MTSFAADLSYVQPTSTSSPSVIYLPEPTQPRIDGVVKIETVVKAPLKTLMIAYFSTRKSGVAI